MPVIEIPMPEEAKNAEGREILRAFLTGGRLQVTLIRAFEEPEVWGMLLADVALRVATVFAEDGKITPADTVKRIAAAFDAEVEKTTPRSFGQQHRN
jgi:hypothetical protein